MPPAAAPLWRNDPALPLPYVLDEPPGEPREGGVLRVGWHQDLVSFDPTFSTSAGTLMRPNLVANRLLRFAGGAAFDPFERRLEPELARSWERSPDGLIYTFHLTDEARWQDVPPLDGRPLLAEDARWAIERYAREGAHRGYLAAMARSEALDEHTLSITLRRPQADFDLPLGSRSFCIYPRELHESGALEGMRGLAGSGPLILEESTPGERLPLRRNPAYGEGAVRLDGLEVVVEPGPARRRGRATATAPLRRTAAGSRTRPSSPTAPSTRSAR